MSNESCVGNVSHIINRATKLTNNYIGGSTIEASSFNTYTEALLDILTSMNVEFKLEGLKSTFLAIRNGGFATEQIIKLHNSFEYPLLELRHTFFGESDLEIQSGDTFIHLNFDSYSSIQVGYNVLIYHEHIVNNETRFYITCKIKDINYISAIIYLEEPVGYDIDNLTQIIIYRDSPTNILSIKQPTFNTGKVVSNSRDLCGNIPYTPTSIKPTDCLFSSTSHCYYYNRSRGLYFGEIEHNRLYYSVLECSLGYGDIDEANEFIDGNIEFMEYVVYSLAIKIMELEKSTDSSQYNTLNSKLFEIKRRVAMFNTTHTRLSIRV